MNLYLDDDSADPLLARLLRQAGHDVQVPQDVGRMGSHDAVHLRHAIDTVRVRLFLICVNLRNLWIGAGSVEARSLTPFSALGFFA